MRVSQRRRYTQAWLNGMACLDHLPLVSTLLALLSLATSACGSSGFKGKPVNSTSQEKSIPKGAEASGEGNAVNSAAGESTPFGTDPAQGKPAGEDLPAGTKLGVDAFLSQVGKGKIDVVWTVDNSASMANESAHIRANLATFMTRIQAERDLKVAIISRANSNLGTYVALSPTDVAAGHVQLNAPVGSFDAMPLAAAASCQPDQTDGNKICNVPLGNVRMQQPGSLGIVRGQLVNFFRQDAKRVYVFVTDDNTIGMSAQNFVSAVSAPAPTLKPTVFGFVATEASKCEIGYSVSREYISLATQTAGAFYDICEPNWDAYFTKLTENILSISDLSYELRVPNVVEILSVKVDGKPLSQGDYLFKDGRVTIDKSLITQAGLRIEIRYAYRE